MKEKDINSLDHTTWRCQYHVVFAPKYRRMVIYNEIKADIGKILRQLCQQKGIEIIAAEAYPDHIHMLLSIPPKYRRMVIYNEIKADIGKILRQLCQQKGIEIIAAEACPDHIHMLLSIPPKYSVSQIMGYLKGKSSLMIFDRHANLKYKYGNRHFWARGYYVDTVGRNKKQIKEYIQNQLREDQIADQMSIKEYVDPFTGSSNQKA